MSMPGPDRDVDHWKSIDTFNRLLKIAKKLLKIPSESLTMESHSLWVKACGSEKTSRKTADQKTVKTKGSQMANWDRSMALFMYRFKANSF